MVSILERKIIQVHSSGTHLSLNKIIVFLIFLVFEHEYYQKCNPPPNQCKVARAYTQIRWALTIFCPLLTEPWLHQRGWFDSCNWYMNCTSKKMYCMLILCIQQIKGMNVFSSDFSGLPCLLQVYTRLHLSDYPKFWNTER